MLQIASMLKSGADSHINTISTLTRQNLCRLLDREDPFGRDWCLLAIKMGLADKLPKMDQTGGARRGQSQMGRLLDEWELKPTSSIGKYNFKEIRYVLKRFSLSMLLICSRFEKSFGRHWKSGCG